MQTDQLKALFMGDAGTEAEAALLQRYDLAVDVLKVGHHGSDTSSSLSFLHELQPQLALVSAGRNNRYHHPSTAIMQRLIRGEYPCAGECPGWCCFYSLQPLFQLLCKRRGGNRYSARIVGMSKA